MNKVFAKASLLDNNKTKISLHLNIKLQKNCSFKTTF